MTALVECRGVTCGYDRPIVEGVDLAIERGEIVALIGGSGSGKSTLLRTLIGLLPPLVGEVRLFGEPLYELPRADRARLLRRTGTAFQHDALFGSMTVADNVGVALRELTDLPAPLVDELVRLKLASLGLAGLEHRLPAEISGGQRKRVALARATILDPELVFCDEPSAGLDPAVAASIDGVLRDLRDALGVTLLVVSHELESIRAVADRVVMLAHGAVHAAGTLDELARSDDELVFNFFHRVAGAPLESSLAR